NPELTIPESRIPNPDSRFPPREQNVILSLSKYPDTICIVLLYRINDSRIPNPDSRIPLPAPNPLSFTRDKISQKYFTQSPCRNKKRDYLCSPFALKFASGKVHKKDCKKYFLFLFVELKKGITFAAAKNRKGNLFPFIF